MKTLAASTHSSVSVNFGIGALEGAPSSINILEESSEEINPKTWNYYIPETRKRVCNWSKSFS